MYSKKNLFEDVARGLNRITESPADDVDYFYNLADELKRYGKIVKTKTTITFTLRSRATFPVTSEITLKTGKIFSSVEFGSLPESDTSMFVQVSSESKMASMIVASMKKLEKHSNE